MKNFIKLFCLIYFIAVLKANGQNYLITFAGTGASTSVGSVKVENLTAGTTLTLNGSDILRLSITTGVNLVENNQSPELKIYPNPMTDNSIVEIYPPVAGDAVLSVHDFSGKRVAQIQSYLENSRQDFLLSGIRNGFYFIDVKGNNYQYSGKLVSNCKSYGTIKIEKVNSVNQNGDDKSAKKVSKAVQTIVDMGYSNGDILKFSAVSGNYSTVITTTPVTDLQVSFDFMACIDGDDNNYPVIKIGSQVWMAENLKTTKYSDGTTIPLVTDPSDWLALSTDAYCWYNNDEITYKSSYGGLYNWYAISTSNNGGKNVCPTSWHVPTDVEWSTLTTYLGGENLAGGKMKATGTLEDGTGLWTSPNYATNESGFTAVPGGSRWATGTFNEISTTGFWWSSTENSMYYSWFRSMMNVSNAANRNNLNKNEGISVRCIKGDYAVLKIGDSYQGGIIAYLLQSGDPGYILGETHGLIAAPSDQGTGIQWYNGSNIATGAKGSAIGTGDANTNAIVTAQGAGSYAAKLCYDLILDGYSDWYLPSQDELNLLYINRNAVGGFGNLYWSSTEYSAELAQCQFFFDGGEGTFGKLTTANVRAVRSF